MFGFDWSEIALIGVVALIAIGPKDMPVAIRAISDTIKKLRRMAGEFQHHVDDMMREADLGDGLRDVKSSLNELRGLNLKNTVQRTLDPDGTLRRAFEDPFIEHKVPRVIEHKGPAMLPLEQPPASSPAPLASPDFIPPASARPQPRPPAFIPPSSGVRDRV